MQALVFVEALWLANGTLDVTGEVVFPEDAGADDVLLLLGLEDDGLFLRILVSDVFATSIS